MYIYPEISKSSILLLCNTVNNNFLSSLLINDKGIEILKLLSIYIRKLLLLRN